MTRKPKRSEAQKKADAKYKDKNRANQKANFKNISATFKKAEAEQIAAIFSAHGVKPAEVIRGAASALADGQPIRTEREPLQAPTNTNNDE